MSYRDSEEYKKKHAEWANAAYHRNKDKYKKLHKEYRESEQGKQKRQQ